jgi:wyosine [tRNA(Phe)-imidazoG37] synthetase (radical SAM superfamily)
VQTLTVTDHSRESAGLTYVYPVVSRRSGGVSVGINLTPNNACNWACVYCQVENLRRGGAPEIDLAQLEEELSGFLHDVLHGDFYDRFRVSAEYRTIRDIAISGNGEATSAREFNRIIDLIGRTAKQMGLIGSIKLVLISNGSLVQRPQVQKGLKLLKRWHGELWFKLDSATDAGIRRINQAPFSAARTRRNLEIAAGLCPTWIQTCVFYYDGEPMPEVERRAYLDLLADLVRRNVPLQGVLLYGLARPSMQPKADRLSPVSDEWLHRFSAEISDLGLEVKVTP